MSVKTAIISSLVILTIAIALAVHFNRLNTTNDSEMPQNSPQQSVVQNQPSPAYPPLPEKKLPDCLTKDCGKG